jgi:hypothetical protein
MPPPTSFWPGTLSRPPEYLAEVAQLDAGYCLTCLLIHDADYTQRHWQKGYRRTDRGGGGLKSSHLKEVRNVLSVP